MPKHGDQNVLPIGIVTVPPSASALNMRRAAASSGAVIDSEKPAKLGLPEQRPSDSMTSVSPTLNEACITLFSLPGGSMPGGGGSGASLLRITMSTLVPSAFV